MRLAFADHCPFTEATGHPLSAASLAPTAGTTILIAADDEDLRDAITFKLEMSGFHTVGVDNGHAALAVAGQQNPRMIILDVTMPQLDGLTVCHELHDRPETAQIPVLMISGQGQPGDVDLGFAVGAEDYLVKPFRQAEMLRRVKWLLMSSGR